MTDKIRIYKTRPDKREWFNNGWFPSAGAAQKYLEYEKLIDHPRIEVRIVEERVHKEDVDMHNVKPGATVYYLYTRIRDKKEREKRRQWRELVRDRGR